MPIQKLTLASGTATAPGTSTPVAIGTLTGDWTLFLNLATFADPTATARFVIEEATSSAFSSPLGLAVFNLAGGFNNAGGVTVSFRKREAAGSDLFGTSGAYARLNIQELNGFLPSVTYNCWIEY